MKAKFRNFITLACVSALVLAVFYSNKVVAATTYNVSSYADLTAAITAASDGDTISITNNITVSAEIAINNKSLSIEGNGFTVSVPIPGLDSSGIYNASPSTWRVFNFNATGKTIELNDMTVKGGSVATNGAGISNTDTTLRMTNVSISNSLGDNAAGGGIYNYGGTVYMKNCNISRNAATYGGGFLNGGFRVISEFPDFEIEPSGAKMFIEDSTFSENRSTSNGGGGGAGENQEGLYINNSTFANNKSTELGGAINSMSGTTYAINSTFSGNVAYGTYAGGAIANHSGSSVAVVNSLFAYNYRNTGDLSTPVYALSDIYASGGADPASAYGSIFQTSDPASVTPDASNITYTGNANGSDNTIFADGATAKILSPTGDELGTNTVYQPFLVKLDSSKTPTALLKVSSFALASGTKTGFTNGDGTPTIGYYNGSSWVTLTGASPSSYQVITDQNGVTRANTPAVGSIESTTSGVYMLKVNSAANGSVNNGTVYGDIYANGAHVALTAIANDGYIFSEWDYILGGSGTASTDNPYIVTVNDNITLAPVFETSSGYTVTYVGNGNTAGSPPSSVEYSSGDNATIANNNTMTKTGYNFEGWNTRENGSGTNYSLGDTYSAGTNLTLYAQWTVSVGDYTPPIFDELPDASAVINVVEGQTITTNPYFIKVKPTDSSGISKVEFYIDDILICTATTPDSDGVYTCSWDTSKYHSTISVYAFDNSVNENRSQLLQRTTVVDLSLLTATTIPAMTELPATGSSH